MQLVVGSNQEGKTEILLGFLPGVIFITQTAVYVSAD